MINRISDYFDDSDGNASKVLLRRVERMSSLLVHLEKRARRIKGKLLRHLCHCKALLDPTVDDLDDPEMWESVQRIESNLIESATPTLDTLSPRQVKDLRRRTAYRDVAPDTWVAELPADHPERLRDALVIEAMRARGWLVE